MATKILAESLQNEGAAHSRCLLYGGDIGFKASLMAAGEARKFSVCERKFLGVRDTPLRSTFDALDELVQSSTCGLQRWGGPQFQTL
jgi:hypothetical protein